MKHITEGMKILPINKHQGFLFFTLTLLLFTSGCKRAKKNSLEGTWSSNNIVATFSNDGKFSLKGGATINNGTYDILESRSSMVLSYFYAEAERHMLTTYSISKDGNTLAINRTCFGTIVLQKRFANSLVKATQTSNQRQNSSSAFKDLGDFENSAFAFGFSNSSASGNEGANAQTSSHESDANATHGTTLAENQFRHGERQVEFQFPTPKKRIYQTRGNHPDPNLWPVLGLSGWMAYSNDESAG